MQRLICLVVDGDDEGDYDGDSARRGRDGVAVVVKAIVKGLVTLGAGGCPLWCRYALPLCLCVLFSLLSFFIYFFLSFTQFG